MFEAEACWLRRALDAYAPERLSPALNLGSSSAAVRGAVQPWIEGEVFCPLRNRKVEIIHVDMRGLPGVDVQADLTNASDLLRLRALRPKALLCCNLLEHVLEPERLARHCLDLLPTGGLVFVTRLLEGTILGAGVSYRDAVRERPWILLRHVCRFPVPFLSFDRWKRSMARLYWLVAEYRITCAVFEKL